MIQKERIKFLNEHPVRNREYVLYWMQASQRTEDNHALEHAVDIANDLRKPVVIFFGITESYPDANERHYAFMMEGLAETARTAEDRGMRFVAVHRSPEKGIAPLGGRACCVVVDRGYTRIQRRWREAVAGGLDCRLIQVESDAVVPVEAASHKEEYGAYTLRPKINKLVPRYLVPLKKRDVRRDSTRMNFPGFSVDDPGKAIQRLKIDRTARRAGAFRGGISQAMKRMEDFLENRLDRYPELSNDPSADCLSNLSPYLHFGQISPLRIALEVKKRKSPGEESFLEELIVRRELSMNFVFYNDRYDELGCIPQWAQATLSAHAGDEREYIYVKEDFEGAQTHDPCWNAAQKEMLCTGKMHGYMRMYWGKKILEWTRTPAEAFKIALTLNNTYELDGRDPNGFAGIAWCFGKHDRAWPERSVFGKVRYMNERGLRRKFDVDAYVRRVDALCSEGSY